MDMVRQGERPPVNVVRFAFQTMVGIGTLLALLGLLYLYIRVRRRSLPAGRWFYLAVLVAGPLSGVALIAGWITTAVGRRPWIFYDVGRVGAAVPGAHPLPDCGRPRWVGRRRLAGDGVGRGGAKRGRRRLWAASGSSSGGPTPAARGRSARRDGRRVALVEDLCALSSVLTRFALAAVVGGTATGRVPVGNARGNIITS